MLFASRTAILILSCVATLAAQAPPPAMPDNVIFEPNLRYAAGPDSGVDIVRPRDNFGAPHPAVLCIHGGGFRAGNKESYLALCIKLASAVMSPRR